MAQQGLQFFRASAVLFDLDGVITPTAELHMRAWAEMFTALFRDLGVEAAYTEQDYFEHLDGRARYEGVQALLESRGVELPWGEPADAVTAETVCGVGNRKNVVFADLLDREGIAAYPGSLAVLDHLTRTGTPVAIVSSSKNARSVLGAAHLLDRFPVIIDGVVAAAESLPGKPQPDLFLRAAQLLHVEPEHAVVVEDAISGVAAGAAGGFGLVLGVDRGVGEAALTAAGAHRVVTDLADLLPESDVKDA